MKKKNIVYSTTFLRIFKIFLFVKIQKIQHELFSLKITLEFRESLYCLNFQLTNQLCHYRITEVITLIYYKWKIKQ